MSKLGVWLMRVLAPCPLPWLRTLGATLGWALYLLAGSRRRVVHTNLRLCFPDLDEASRTRLCQKHFVAFAQAWLDRAWLWHGSDAQLSARLRLTGSVSTLTNDRQPTVMFAPHFVGLDAGWIALTRGVSRHFTTIYTPQSNRTVDAWIRQGRQRFDGPDGRARLFLRSEGVKAIVAALRGGDPLYLLPDMNFGEEDSLFVPFFGIQAATVPSLPRFAKLGRAQVVPVLSRLTPNGYEIEVLPAWSDYPGADPQADTALMNLRLEQYIRSMPHQYFWVHKRFKSRPTGEPSVY